MENVSEEKKYIKSIFIIIGIISFFLFGFLILGISSIPQSPSISSGINYNAYVCIYKNGELQECNHNLLYSAGKNLTRDLLSGGGNFIRNISICNASAGTTSCAVPVDAATESFTSYNACGLIDTAGTYQQINANDGNWSIVATFTSTCDNRITNVTRLKNASGTLFASNTFTSVTLQNNDQLTVNWTISVT